jgi:hypothetical protein
MKKFLKITFYILLIALVIIQFIRPTRNTGIAANENDITHFTNVSPEVKTILETSCYDCHSDHTEYPWYTNIQPVGWWMTNHINEGKNHLNFSTFNSYPVSRKMRRLKGTANEVKEDEMPLDSYLWIHHNAEMTDAQKKLIEDWAMKNFDSLAKLYPDSIPKPRR